MFMIGMYGVKNKPAEMNEISADNISEIKVMTSRGLLSVKFKKDITIMLSCKILCTYSF